MFSDSRTDDELFAATCDGDSVAFESLSERYRPRLTQYADVAGRGEIDAEAAVQEALIRAYGARHRYRPESCFSAWMYTILRNEVRRSQRRKHTLPLETVQIARGADPQETLMRQERIEMVRNALEMLPRLQREAITLTKFGELSCREAARVLRTSDGAIRTAIYKGLKTLRKRLDDNE